MHVNSARSDESGMGIVDCSCRDEKIVEDENTSYAKMPKIACWYCEECRFCFAWITECSYIL